MGKNRLGLAYMNRTFLQARLDAVEAQITAYEAAVAALDSPGIQAYSLDTGQTRQTVTRVDLDMLFKTLDHLYVRYETLYNRLNGGATIILRSPRG